MQWDPSDIDFQGDAWQDDEVPPHPYTHTTAPAPTLTPRAIPVFLEATFGSQAGGDAMSGSSRLGGSRGTAVDDLDPRTLVPS